MNNKTLIAILKISTITVLLGRAWQFLFWDAPYRTILWDESLMTGIVNHLLGISWNEYATSKTIYDNVQIVIILTGITYLLTAILTFFYNKKRKWISYFLWLAAANLLLLFFLMTSKRFYQLGMFFEHAAQLMSPVLLIIVIENYASRNKLLFFLKITAALTFICHGLYAINYYPRPGKYVDLVINSTGMPEDFAHPFILTAGILDFIVAALLFVPKPKIVFWAATYMVIWGGLTALSRAVAGFNIDFPLESIHQSFYSFVYRICHATIPLTIALLVSYKPEFIKNIHTKN